MTYAPGLDGLRALAILLVIAFHAKAPFALGGYVGVDLFFVLSGYLITRLAGDAQFSDVGRFYARRARRLLPALLTMLFVYLLVAPIVWPAGEHLRDAALAALYLSSYSFAHMGAPDILRHTWSLSVEAHFYLLWPFVLIATGGQRRLLWLALLYVAATAWRMHLAGSVEWAALYARADTHCTGLILGSIVATLPSTRAPKWLLPLGIGGLLCGSGVLEWQSEAWPAIGQTLIEISSACCVLGAASSRGWIAHPAIAYLGKLSYGAYLWHYPVVRWCRDAGLPWEDQLFISATAGFVMAAISYHTIEAAFRKPRVTRHQSVGATVL